MQDQQFSINVKFNQRSYYCIIMRGDRPDSVTYVVCILGLKSYMDVFEICVSADKGTEKPKWQQQSDPVGDETVDEQLIDAIGEEIEVYYFDATKDHGR